MALSLHAVIAACTLSNVLQLFGVLFLILIALFVSRTLFRALYSPYLGRILGHQVDLRSMGQWAVITGATDGIGKAYTEELAKLGINIVLISRSLDKLKTVAAALEDDFKVSTKIIAADFTKGIEIYDHIRKGLEGLQIGILINNVGMSYDYPEYLGDIPNGDQFVFDMIHCNSISCVMMCRIVLPLMQKRRKGVIVNVSSAGGNVTLPMLSLYGASKTFVNRISEGLRYEYKQFGITIQNVTPFYVSTKLSKMRSNSFWIPTPTQYVQYQLQTIGLENKTYGYSSHKIMGFVGETLTGSVDSLRTQFECYLTNKLQAGRKSYLRNKEKYNKSR